MASLIQLASPRRGLLAANTLYSTFITGFNEIKAIGLPSPSTVNRKGFDNMDVPLKDDSHRTTFSSRQVAHAFLASR